MAKVAGQCSVDTFVANQSLILRISICDENRHLRQAANRQAVKKSLFSPDNQLSQSNIFVLSQAEFCYVWVSVKNI